MSYGWMFALLWIKGDCFSLLFLKQHIIKPWLQNVKNKNVFLNVQPFLFSKRAMSVNVLPKEKCVKIQRKISIT